MLYTLKTEDNKYIKLNDWAISYHDEFTVNDFEYSYIEEMAKHISNTIKKKIFVNMVEVRYHSIVEPQLYFEDLLIGDVFTLCKSGSRFVKISENQHICVEEIPDYSYTVGIIGKEDKIPVYR